MNPFLDPTRAEPRPGVFRLRGARRRAGAAALALGLAVLASAPAQGAVDANHATQEQLEGVRGIGPKTAAAIVAARRQGGAFRSFEDLSGRVRGLGGKRLDKLRAAGLAVGGAEQAPGAKPGMLFDKQPEMMVNMPPANKGKGSRGKGG